MFVELIVTERSLPVSQLMGMDRILGWEAVYSQALIIGNNS